MPRRRTLSMAVVLGVLVAGVAIFAHFSGLLAPIYHRLGWHALMRTAEQGSSENASMAQHDEYAGHGGMSMPGTEAMEMPADESPAAAPQPSSLPGYATVSITP